MSSKATNTNNKSVSSASTQFITLPGNTVAGNLLTWVQFFNPGAITNFNITDTQGNTWQTAVLKAGSNPPDRRVVIAWAIAGSSAAITATATWTESANGNVVMDEWNVAGVGDIEAVLTGSFEETSEVSAHNSAESPGLTAQDDDVMLSGGVGDGGLSGPTAGTDWTGSAFGIGFRQYRLPTGAVTDNRGPWTSGANRRAASAMVIFRRVEDTPEPEVVFQHARIRTRGLNSRVN